MKNVKFYTKNDNSDKKNANVCHKNDNRIFHVAGDENVVNLTFVTSNWPFNDLQKQIFSCILFVPSRLTRWYTTRPCLKKFIILPSPTPKPIKILSQVKIEKNRFLLCQCACHCQILAKSGQNYRNSGTNKYLAT